MVRYGGSILPRDTTNDRYVIYNYQEKIWYFGTLTRTAWVDRGINQYPIAASTDNKLYYHEFGQDDGSTNPPSAISANVESSQMDIGDGDKFIQHGVFCPTSRLETVQMRHHGSIWW